MKVLLIEDEPSLSRNIKTYLELKKVKCETALDWEKWLELALTKDFDAIILDIKLPKLNWFEVCKKIRDRQKNTCILMLTSMSTKNNIIHWLEIWADDYLSKPFDYEELLARLNSIVRRNALVKSSDIKIMDITIDTSKKYVKKWEEEIKLSSLEFDLLLFLARNKGKVLSRWEIAEKVWWDFDYIFSKNVEVYIWYLRKKLWKNLIQTKKWQWYLID